jgi:signal peptidase I
MRELPEIFETEELSEGNNTLREFIGFLREIIIIFIIVIMIRTFVITPFRINGTSMETSYHDREYIIVDKFSYLNLPITYNEGVQNESQL